MLVSFSHGTFDVSRIDILGERITKIELFNPQSLELKILVNVLFDGLMFGAGYLSLFDLVHFLRNQCV